MKKKLLPLALAAAAGLAGVTAQAQKMSLNADGTGQLLMYPIYTANGGNDTYLSLVNTTSTYKAVKVRFVDAMNSQDSLDFHLYLSPQDHWSAVVTKDAATGGAVLKTGDTSCTVPNSLSAKAIGSLGTTAPFSTIKYGAGGAEADTINNGIDRTLEGHIEIIEMGTLDSTAGLLNAAVTAGTGGTAAQKSTVAFAADILHATSGAKKGIPGGCADVDTAWKNGGYFARAALPVVLDKPTGGMYGYGVIINVPDGTAAMFDAVAVDGFMDQAYHPAPGDDEPGLDDGVATSRVLVTSSAGTAADVGTLVDFTAGAAQAAVVAGAGAAPSVVVAPNASSNFHVNATRGRTGSVLSGGGSATTAFGSKEALSALLMRTSIANDYVLDSALNAATDWVVTFPTKRDFVNLSPAGTAGVTAANTAAAQYKAERPFSALWDHAKTESCSPITIDYWDREEAKEAITSTTFFSPAPIVAPTVISLCTESNILNFNGKGVLGGSTRITKDTTLATGFSNGWAKLGFTNAQQYLGDTAFAGTNAVPTAGVVVNGLPVIGFAIQKYVNGSNAGTLANYAGSIGHHYTSSVITD